VGQAYDAKFTAAYATFQGKSLRRAYGSRYFKWNIGYSILRALLSGGAVALAITQAHDLVVVWHTATILTLAALNAVHVPDAAPTRKARPCAQREASNVYSGDRREAAS